MHFEIQHIILFNKLKKKRRLAWILEVLFIYKKVFYNWVSFHVPDLA